MKKAINWILVIIYLIMTLIVTWLNVDVGKYIIFSAIYFIASFIILFETNSINSKTLTAVAILSTIAGTLRVPFSVIPGFQPVTFICAISGYCLGPINGFMVGSMAAFISNFFLGHGPWTMWQMLAWGICGWSFGVLRPILEKTGIKGIIIFCGIWGYLYGIILDQWYIIQFMNPITLKAVITGIILSFPHDTIHAIGNLIITYYFGKDFIEVLERYNKRNKVIYIDDK